MNQKNIPKVVFIGAKETGKSITINNIWSNTIVYNNEPFYVSEFIEGRGVVDYQVIELPYVPFALKDETNNWILSNQDTLKEADVIVYLVSASDISIKKRADLILEFKSKGLLKQTVYFVLAISCVEELVNIEILNDQYVLNLNDLSSLLHVKNLFFNEFSKRINDSQFNIERTVLFSYRAMWQLEHLKSAITEGIIKRYNEITFDDKLETIVFIGKTGCGKSSTINTLCDTDLPVDGAVACTKYPIVIRKKLNVGGREKELNIVDLPGIAESLEANMLYEDYYATYLKAASVVVCLSQANTRAYSQDEEFYKRMIASELISENTNLILGINKIDLIFKSDVNINGIDLSTITDRDPLIVDKINDYYNNVFANIFSVLKNVTLDSVVVYSNLQNWNMETLKDKISQYLTI